MESLTVEAKGHGKHFCNMSECQKTLVLPLSDCFTLFPNYIFLTVLQGKFIGPMGPSALECLERHLLLECGMCATSLLGVGWQELQPSGWKGDAHQKYPC